MDLGFEFRGMFNQGLGFKGSRFADVGMPQNPMCVYVCVCACVFYANSTLDGQPWHDALYLNHLDAMNYGAIPHVESGRLFSINGMTSGGPAGAADFGLKITHPDMAVLPSQTFPFTLEVPLSP